MKLKIVAITTPAKSLYLILQFSFCIIHFSFIFLRLNGFARYKLKIKLWQNQAHTKVCGYHVYVAKKYNR